MTVISDLDGTLQATNYLWEMLDRGCLTLDQLNAKLLETPPFAWVRELCRLMAPNEAFKIITGRKLENAEATEAWVRQHVPRPHVHVQLLGDEIWLAGDSVTNNVRRYEHFKQQALDDAIAIASSNRKIGEWILVLEDSTKLIAYAVEKHSRVPGIVVAAIGGLGRIHVVNDNGSGAIDPRWFHLVMN